MSSWKCQARHFESLSLEVNKGEMLRIGNNLNSGGIQSKDASVNTHNGKRQEIQRRGINLAS